ncbi:MAG TPA: helix-turn-helix domain-containing protein, partial [Myxococcota bacterium]|nr:helix-turn-helix domain-containing protein [Myxococcota bacterium]
EMKAGRARKSGGRAEGAAAAASDSPASRAAAKEETREALVRAAMQAFAEEGLDAPSLDAICARAGLTRGAFYVHFASRDDLIVAVMARASVWMMDVLIQSGDAALDLRNTVRAFAGAVAGGAYPRSGRVRLHHVLDACARSPSIRAGRVAVLSEARTRLAAAARRGQKAGTVRRDVEAGALAEVLLSLVLGVEVILALDFPFDVRAGAEAILRAFAGQRGAAAPE